MKYLAMFMEILGNALFTLIGFCILCGIVGLIIYSVVSLYDGVNKGRNYVNDLTRKTFKKYTFSPEDKTIFKDKWRDLF